MTITTQFLISNAYAQAAPGGADTGYILSQVGMIVLIVLVFYFLIIRPQQRRLKQHQEMVNGLQKGDTIVTSGGMIGKVKGVQDDEVRVEIAPNVEVRVVKGTVAEVRNKGAPAPANDSKPAKSE